MKLLLSALLFVGASAAQASPAVNDQAVFQGTWDGKAVYQAVTYTAYNAATRQFTRNIVTKIGDDAPVAADQYDNYDDTSSDAAMQYMVTNCVSVYKGTSEMVSVPAGTFPTCKMALQQGGFVWVGVVPFAVVKIETPVDGKPLSAWLISFNRGK